MKWEIAQILYYGLDANPLSDPNTEVGVMITKNDADYLLVRFANDSKDDLKKIWGET
jgi:hypothetical protein